MGEGFALTRKYGVDMPVFYDVMTDGLFNCSAYKVYGKIMVDESYSKVGQMAVLGLKDANLALEAGGLKGVPLPSGNVWRDRLVGAVAHGDGDKDWAVMALEQAPRQRVGVKDQIMSTAFDFTPLLPRRPAARRRSNTPACRNTISPAATTIPTSCRSTAWSRQPTAVLKREGRDACDLRPRQRSAGLSAAARVPGREAQARRRHRLHRRRHPDHLGLAAGARSGQRRAARRAATPSSSSRTATRARSTG